MPDRHSRAFSPVQMLENGLNMHSAVSIGFRQHARPLLVYILGWGRSGSSVMANILGSMPDAASLGEMRYLWDRGVMEDGICGCEAAFSECAFWPDLSFGAQPLKAMDSERARALTRSIGSGARRRQFPGLHNERSRKTYFDRSAGDLDLLMGLYAEAFERSQSRVLIDASKSPFYALNLLYEQRSFDVVFLHLVRDPRAVLHSWKKRKPREDVSEGQLFPRYSSTRSLLQWAVVNAECERFAHLAPDRYYRVRFEDFAENWQRALATDAAPLFEQVPGGRGGENSRAALVHAQHSISGNPARFILGEVTLDPNTSWRDEISGTDRRLARMICGPAARRYGYVMGAV
ncbi:sulfotransferase [Roseobacter denitrificans]|uniref:sulfotransferase n=1 Tax=Roseobacter denitrificans TaxID=2434 RepID=UPI00209B52BF|nr:sulfotransferase [Roseobacter denitrificans]